MTVKYVRTWEINIPDNEINKEVVHLFFSPENIYGNTITQKARHIALQLLYKYNSANDEKLPNALISNLKNIILEKYNMFFAE